MPLIRKAWEFHQERKEDRKYRYLSVSTPLPDLTSCLTDTIAGCSSSTSTAKFWRSGKRKADTELKNGSKE